MAIEPPAAAAKALEPRPTPIWAGLALLTIAGLAIFGALFFLSPNAMSAAHQTDKSLLKPIINLMALANADGSASRFPTPRGVEIRDLFFHLGAAALTFVMGLVFLLRPPNYALASQHVFDIKQQAKNPIAWFVLLLFISLVSSFFAPAPELSMGGVILRLMTLGWWLPLALILQPQQSGKLALMVLGVLSTIAVLGIAYWFFRDVPNHPGKPQLGLGVQPRLIFPMGNPTLLGACMLPAIFIGLAPFLSPRTADENGTSKSTPPLITYAGPMGSLLCLGVLYLTAGRAAQVGFIAGLFMVLLARVSKQSRMIVLLVFLVLAVAGMNYVNNLRATGVMGDRSHSIRSRLNHEWPYAISLWTQKLVGGHGEGGYTMQTGPLVRSEQLQDPNVLAIDSFRWTAHAHNVFLELLANLGFAGALCFVAALAFTFLQALRWLDHTNHDLALRGLVIALMAGLFAMVVEEGASVSLFKPGFPPIFFTTWACLFALTRDACQHLATTGENAANERNVRLLGAAAILFALGMSYAGIQNWRGTRAQQRANEYRQANDFSEAIAAHDFAGSTILEPFRRIIARQNAVEARVIQFRQHVESTTQVTDELFQQAQEAYILWSDLDKAVPRFMEMSHIAWELEFARYRAFAKGGNTQQATASILDYSARLQQCRADEPFDFSYLQRLWSDYLIVTPNNQVIPSLDPRLRWQWLREYLRRNEIDPNVQMMIQSLTAYPVAMRVFNDLINIANQDAEKKAGTWDDILAPETLRIGAVVAKLKGQKNALDFVDKAIQMYDAAGGRLFTAHAAALRESAQLMLVQQPAADPTEALRRLVVAYEVKEGVTPGSMEEKIERPLPGDLGQTRLALLLAAGNEAAARAQIEFLFEGTATERQQQLATAYLRLAESFVNAPQHVDRALSYVAKAEELAKPARASRLLAAHLHLVEQNMAATLDSARTAIEIDADRNAAYAYLQRLEAAYPDASIWARLRDQYDDYPPPPEQPAALTTQPVDENPSPSNDITRPIVGSTMNDDS